MRSLTDITGYREALDSFSKERLWALFDGDRANLNIGHECIDRHPPDRLALHIIDSAGDDEQYTFGEIGIWSSRFANYLEQTGVARGSTIAIMLEPSLAFYASLFGAMKAGCVAVPLFTLFGPDGIKLRLDDCAPSLFLASPADALLGENDGRLELIYTVPGDISEEDRILGEERIAATIASSEITADLHTRIVSAPSVRDGIVWEAREADLLVIGTSREGIFERSFFGGLPFQVARLTETPTFFVRGIETPRFRLLQHIWGLLTDFLPTLTPRQHDDVIEDMRSAAIPTVDYYVLMVLAAAIASVGLLQNSTAVIIGAMLVAPLMNPILAMAMGMVIGDLRTLSVGTEAVIKGATMAILVAVLLVVISPIDEPTSEILSRTQPNILDLLVALFSGLAAGYSVSRKEVSGALPGVAIAAALVPPLSVVGYGVAIANFEVAFGALLLFITNLIAIILAAAVIFLALNFQPARMAMGELRKNLRLTLFSLLGISAILLVITAITVRQANMQNELDTIFNSAIVSNAARVQTTDVRREGGTYIVDAVILNYVDSHLTANALIAVEQELEAGSHHHLSLRA